MTGEDWDFKLESFLTARRRHYTKGPVKPWDEAKVKKRSEKAKERVRKRYKTKKAAKDLALMEQHACKSLVQIHATNPGACLTD